MSEISIKPLLLGPMENFCYLIGAPGSKEYAVVDPAWDIDVILKECDKDQRKLSAVLLTHYHPDHCGGRYAGFNVPGVKELLDKVDVPVYANEHEIPGLKIITGLPESSFTPCKGGDNLNLAGLNICTLHTPGHTPGSQCFLCQDHLVSGDTLFISGCGRVDLPGGNIEQMYDSLNNKLSKLPDQTLLHPGHNYDHRSEAPFSEVKKINPYLAARGWKEFVDERLS